MTIKNLSKIHSAELEGINAKLIEAVDRLLDQLLDVGQKKDSPDLLKSHANDLGCNCRFSKPCSAINKQRIICKSRIISHGQCSCMGQFVKTANNKTVLRGANQKGKFLPKASKTIIPPRIPIEYIAPFFK